MTIKTKKFFRIVAVVTAVLGLSSCAAVRLNSNAERVIASPSKAPMGCKFLGQVSGNQGNLISGKFTSNQNLDEGAQNDLRNKAAAKGGNYVQIVTNQASSYGGTSSGFGGGLEQTGDTAVGNVYRCIPKSIGE